MKIWVLGDDRVGNTHQAIALAEKLAGEYILIKLKYNCLAKLPNFLLKYYPVHIKNELLKDITAKPLPDVIITAGRRTAALAYYLKKTSERKIKLLQIMQPSLPYEAFEAVILPFHDCALSSSKNSYVIPAKAGIQKKILTRLDSCCRGNDIEKSRNDTPIIIPINGALNNITEKFTATSLDLTKHYPNLDQFIAVIIGGNSKKFNFTEKEAALFSSLFKKIYDNQKIPFFISFSRRTPDSVKSIINNNMPTSTIIYDPTVENISPRTTTYKKLREDASTGLTPKLPLEVEFGNISEFNPYIGMLAEAKYIISTADSISMCSEAASSGKPLYIFCPLNFNSPKHKIFIKQLVEQKIARMFDKSITFLEEYSYPPLNETERIVKIIRPLISKIDN